MDHSYLIKPGRILSAINYEYDPIFDVDDL